MSFGQDLFCSCSWLQAHVCFYIFENSLHLKFCFSLKFSSFNFAIDGDSSHTRNTSGLIHFLLEVQTGKRSPKWDELQRWGSNRLQWFGSRYKPQKVFLFRDKENYHQLYNKAWGRRIWKCLQRNHSRKQKQCARSNKAIEHIKTEWEAVYEWSCNSRKNPS